MRKTDGAMVVVVGDGPGDKVEEILFEGDGITVK
jgi:hypothetical protein